MSTEYNPFQSPEASLRPGGVSAWPVIPFQSGHPRAMTTIVLLAVTVLLCILGALACAVEFDSLQEQPNGSFKLTGSGAAIAESANAISNVSLYVWAATIVVFCMWTHRAERNLPALGALRLKYTPGWAVGWFFVPLANLVMPFFVAAEIWRESDPRQKHSEGQEPKSTSPLVAIWWFTYVIYMVVPTLLGAGLAVTIGLSVVNLPGNPQDLVEERITHYLPQLLLYSLAAYLLGLLASLLAILYVYRVDANQQATHEQIHGQGFIA